LAGAPLGCTPPTEREQPDATGHLFHAQDGGFRLIERRVPTVQPPRARSDWPRVMDPGSRPFRRLARRGSPCRVRLSPMPRRSPPCRRISSLSHLSRAVCPQRSRCDKFSEVQHGSCCRRRCLGGRVRRAISTDRARPHLGTPAALPHWGGRRVPDVVTWSSSHRRPIRGRVNRADRDQARQVGVVATDPDTGSMCTRRAGRAPFRRVLGAVARGSTSAPPGGVCRNRVAPSRA
jgi:hypothetical protein